MKKRYHFFPKNWLRTGMITAFAASLSFNLQAQTGPAKLWDKTFGGSGYDWFTSLKQTSDGGYILGGYSTSDICNDKSQNSKGGTDYWVVKLDAGFNKVWDKTIGGSSYDDLRNLKQTADGGYILGGTSGSGISGDKTQNSRGIYDYWVVKMDASGNKTWDKSFGGSQYEFCTSLQQTTDGGYILGGSSDSGISGEKNQASKGSFDYWVLKLDASGNKIWDKTFGGSGLDALTSLQQTSDGGYILGGSSNSGISGDKTQASKDSTDYWVVKLDASGNKVWDKTFGGNKVDELISLQQTTDGGYILGGSSRSDISGDKSQNSKGSEDYWVLKLDVNGNKTWDKTFGGSSHEYFGSIQPTLDGGYIVGGWSCSPISGDKTQPLLGVSNNWAVKLDASGNKTWDKTLGGNSVDRLLSVLQTADGSYFLGGESSSNASGDKSNNSQLWDIWIVKLGGNATGIKETEAGFAVTISPNPSQGKFNLQVSNFTAPTIAVTVSDLLGRVVLQQELRATNGQITEELTLSNTKGIYLLQLKAGKQIITRKVVVE